MLLWCIRFSISIDDFYVNLIVRSKARLLYNYYELNSILRRHYGFIMTASSDKIYSVLGGSDGPNTEYIFSQRRHYRAAMSSQNRLKFILSVR